METMSTNPDLRTAAQAVIDRWETPLWKDAPATAGYIAALRDALAADHTEHHLEMVGRWYMVTQDGAATLCVDREDAEAEARKADREWPRNGPHRAVQLAEAQATALAKPYCHEDCMAYTAGIEKELQDAQAAAHPALPEIKDMHNAPQFLNLNDRAMWVIGWNECRDAMRDSAMRTTQPAPMESVLVDGIAYQTPAPVAAELLRLHIDALKPAPRHQARINGDSAAPKLRAMATNYPAGHQWDKLDAQACIRGALEIEALRSQTPQPSPAAQVDALDAARLDWLIEQDNCVVFEGVNGFCLCWIDEHDPQQSEYQTGTFPTARAAIDAARAAQEGK